MSNTENTENYTMQEFGKDVAKEVAKTTTAVVAGYALFFGSVIAVNKLVELKNARAAKKAENQ